MAGMRSHRFRQTQVRRSAAKSHVRTGRLAGAPHRSARSAALDLTAVAVTGFPIDLSPVSASQAEPLVEPQASLLGRNLCGFSGFLVPAAARHPAQTAEAAQCQRWTTEPDANQLVHLHRQTQTWIESPGSKADGQPTSMALDQAASALYTAPATDLTGRFCVCYDLPPETARQF
jgi:hypothetical protein